MGDVWRHRVSVPLAPGFFRPLTAVDPYFSSVLLLLHFDNGNGSTTFTDSSSYNRTMTSSGTQTNIDLKFGPSSYSPGTNSLYTSSSADFDMFGGDYTIEGWYKQSTDNLNTYQLYQQTVDVNNRVFVYNSLGTMYLGTVVSGVFNTYISGTTPAAGVGWYHFAQTKSGSSTRLFVAGTQFGSTSTTVSYPTGSNMKFAVGEEDTTPHFFFPGYIDDVRVTKGVARYTSNFTPPVSPFPNH